MRGTVGLAGLYKRYHEQVQFLPIYIAEAHPTDGWWLGYQPMKWMLTFYSPKVSFGMRVHKTMSERRAAARECEQALQYGIHSYVDEINDAVNKTYAAHPTRLYLIGLDGRVIYAAGLGPYDFHPWKLGRAIEQYLKVMES